MSYKKVAASELPTKDLLVHIMEEASEVVQAASKFHRFENELDAVELFGEFEQLYSLISTLATRLKMPRHMSRLNLEEQMRWVRYGEEEGPDA